MPSIICNRDGCARLATHSIKLCVPIAGLPQDEKRCFSMILAIRLCLAHAGEFKVEQILDAPTPKGDGTFRSVLPIFARLGGSPEPDADRSWIVPVPLASAEFKASEAAINKSNRAPPP